MSSLVQFIILTAAIFGLVIISSKENKEKFKRGITAISQALKFLFFTLPMTTFSSKNNSPLILVFLYESIIGAIAFSLLGLIINLVINNDAFCFQWGLSKRVDTGLLKDYKFIRDMFLFIGVGVGVLMTTISQLKANKKPQSSL